WLSTGSAANGSSPRNKSPRTGRALGTACAASTAFGNTLATSLTLPLTHFLTFSFGAAAYTRALRPRFVQATTATASQPALDSARRKAYWRLLPLLFICYVI